MTTRVNRYRCFCQTENAYVYAWDEAAPNKCPNNNTHTILPEMTTIIDTVSTQNVFASKDTGGVGKGYYMYEGDQFDVNFGTNIYDKSFPFDIRIFGFQFNASAEYKNDKIDVIMAPDAVVGVLAASAAQGNVTITVSPTVMQYLDIGHHVKLTNGVNKFHDGGIVIGKNEAKNTITINTPLSVAFDAFEAYVLRDLYMVKNLYIRTPGSYSAGYGTGDSKIIPANTVMRMVYNCQNSNQTPLKFAFQFEYTY